MHDCAQSVPVCAVFDLLCKGTVESVPEGTGSVRMECFTEVLPGTKAAPHNYVCGSQRIFCTSSAVSKTGNTYSIPSFLKLCTGTKSLAELPCQIMRCCPKYKCVGGLSVFGSPPLKLRGGLFGEFPAS